MLGFIALAAASIASTSGHWQLRSPVAHEGNAVTVAELVTAGSLHSGNAASAADVVLRVPDGGIVLSAAAVANLLRRRVPGAVIDVPNPDATIVFASKETQRLPSVSTRRCFRAQRPLAGNVVLTNGDLERAPCTGSAIAAVRYDRAKRDLRTTAPVAEGTYLGPIGAADGADVAPGTGLTLRAEVGPALIERSVVALQSGHSGRRLFVKTADGSVLSVPLSIVPGENR